MFIKPDQLKKVLDTINGRIPEDAVLQDMKAFFKEEFGVEIFDYICDYIEHLGKQEPRLRIAVWDGAAQRPFFCRPDRELENQIKDRFSRSCRDHDLHPDFFDPKGYFAVVTPIKREVEEKLMNEETRRKISALLQNFPEVKKHRYAVPTVFVFYETDADIDIYQASGLSKKIYEAISAVLGSEPGLEGRKLGDVRFSSLETFEGKYKGNFRGFWLDN